MGSAINLRINRVRWSLAMYRRQHILGRHQRHTHPRGNGGAADVGHEYDMVELS